MLKENQFVTVKWNPYSQKYYQSKGYVFTKRGDEFQVKIEDLQEGSHAVPTIDELMDRINFLLTTIHTYTYIELD